MEVYLKDMGTYCPNKDCDWWDLGEAVLYDDGTITHKCPKCKTPMHVKEDSVRNAEFLRNKK